MLQAEEENKLYIFENRIYLGYSKEMRTNIIVFSTIKFKSLLALIFFTSFAATPAWQ